MISHLREKLFEQKGVPSFTSNTYIAAYEETRNFPPKSTNNAENMKNFRLHKLFDY